jgi:hypothetical protein
MLNYEFLTSLTIFYRERSLSKNSTRALVGSVYKIKTHDKGVNSHTTGISITKAETDMAMSVECLITTVILASLFVRWQ